MPLDAPTLLILAAGMGSRYGGLKQVVPVNPAGEAIVDYAVYDAVRAGFARVVFVIRKEIEELFKESVSRRFERHVEVDYAFQELDSLPSGCKCPTGRTKPWGTLHATLVGAERIQGPFAVINADDFYGAESYRLLGRHLHSGSAGCAMVGFKLRDTLSDFGSVSRGVCTLDDDGLLCQVVERTQVVRDGMGARSTGADGREMALSGDEVVSMNMWGFTTGMLGYLRQCFREFLEAHGTESQAESYLPNAVNRLVGAGQACFKVLHTDAAWCGITYAQDHAAVVRTIRDLTRRQEYPETLWG